jgi:tRNA A-37 threonylcarbamoyl transferase component Bud32
MGGQAQGTDRRLLADRYRLGEVLGKGGMGTVWRALDETLGRTVAVKELRFPRDIDDDEKRRLITRTLREAKATARIRNTSAVTVFDVVEEDDRPWIVMELVEGRSLSDAIREDGPLTPKRAAEVGLAVLDVLKAAHKEGILHRDVKPSNVLIAEDGRVVLTDFGIAQIDGDPSVTSTGMLVGAPSYISPERARGQKPGPPADLWSLGALLYACIEGRPPYDKGSAIATLTAVMTEQLQMPKNAGPLAGAIRGLLIKNPDQRLDDTGVRPLLTEVANAPVTPVAPAPDATRTVPLPADPQPTPTDAPAAAQRAAAAQAEVRRALRSLRKQLPKPGPARQLDGGESRPVAASNAVPPRDPHAASLPPLAWGAGRRRSRALVVAAVVMVVAVLCALIGLALARTGHHGGQGGGRSRGGGSSATTAQTEAASEATGTGGSATTNDAVKSAPASPTHRSTPFTGSSPSKLPRGYQWVSSGRYHFSMAMPSGWAPRETAGQGSGERYWGSSRYPRVQVDYTSTPGTDAAAAWEAQEPTARRGFRDYHRVSIRSVGYRGYLTAADWEFTFRSGGTAMRAVDRGFVVDGSHAYAIFFVAPAADWNSAAVRQMRHTFYKTFKAVK